MISGVLQAPERPPTFRREAAWTVGAFVLVAGFASLFVIGDPRYFWHDDAQLGYQPLFADVARSLREGEFPLVSPYSWQSGALAGEYQAGVFSAWFVGWICAVFALPIALPLKAAFLAVLHLGVLAAGTFRLARRQGLRPEEGLLAALVASLNGWVFIWGAMNWVGHLAAFAWLPWVWWALDRALEDRGATGHIVVAGVFIYLSVTAGWVFVVPMIGVVTAWLALRSWRGGRRVRDLWPLAAAWLCGLGLSAPAWLMLLQHGSSTVRGQVDLTSLNWEWSVPPAALPGLVFPFLTVPWRVFWLGKLPHVCVELTGGLVPLALIAGAWWRFGREYPRRLRWELALTLAVLLLAMGPGVGNLRWSFRWLPLFFLGLGLTGARSLALLRLPSPVSNETAPVRPAVWAVATMLLVCLGGLAWSSWPRPLVVGSGLMLAVCCLPWVLAERRGAEYAGWAACVAALAMFRVTYWNSTSLLCVCTWYVPDSPVDPHRLKSDVCYLSLFERDHIVGDDGQGTGTDLLPGNLSLLAGVRCVHGYSPLRSPGLTAWLECAPQGYSNPDAIRRILAQETGPDGVLALLGVDGLLVAHRHADDPRADGWEVTDTGESGIILHRRGSPSPRVRVLHGVEWTTDAANTCRRLTAKRSGPAPLFLEGDRPDGEQVGSGRATVGVTGESRTRLEVQVTATGLHGDIAVALARPWYPGLEAHFNGRPIPIHRLNMMQPAVVLPPGSSGQLVVRYRPWSLVWGVAVALLTAAVVTAVLALRVLQRRSRGSRKPAEPQTCLPSLLELNTSEGTYDCHVVGR
jgi:hypothetical protein